MGRHRRYTHRMAGITLIPILGDQLSYHLSSLRDADPATSVILMAEAEDETTYVRHHRRKLAYILSAMRHHAEALRARGWTVEYVTLDDPDNSHSFTGEVARACQRHDVERIVVTDTIPLRPGAPDNITVLSTAPTLADSIRRIFADDSVSEIFAGENQLF